ncbi:MAG TPA: decarboxylating 6-phosphogluconate dehydrogenase [Eoetvoesiella sp.]
MQLGMIGLGRMGSDMARRLMKQGHECVVYDIHAAAVAKLQQSGAVGTCELETFVSLLSRPRAVWLMLPAAAVDQELQKLAALLDPGDIVIDGGNSYYRDDIRRSFDLQSKKIHYLDIGTSGGVFGLERGYCLMIGGEVDIVRHLTPVFAALAPGANTAASDSEANKQSSTAELGYLHCGPHGAGHFVKMIHNGIEYGIMAAYAEGLNILHNANIGSGEENADAETTPLRNPEFYQYTFDLPQIAELWRHGSVIGSWLLDLTASALQTDPTLRQYEGRVSDSGEGRWTIMAAIDEAVPVPVLSAALYARFSSRGGADFANKILSAMRHQFGGHIEKPHSESGD